MVEGRTLKRKMAFYRMLKGAVLVVVVVIGLYMGHGFIDNTNNISLYGTREPNSSKLSISENTKINKRSNPCKPETKTDKSTKPTNSEVKDNSSRPGEETSKEATIQIDKNENSINSEMLNQSTPNKHLIDTISKEIDSTDKKKDPQDIPYLNK